MSSPVNPEYADGTAPELVSRLRVIEGQPLSTRAAAYAGIHEELTKRLESVPAASSAATADEPA
ncbi:MAG TPA: hypothetical protein VNT50_09705 [Microbacterium sp.]|uniref:hypothetical protein n=1 Tax=Microbacterium sp. TaxID=51671 RepID=UPI002C99BC4D|nr:hypothetical protein [Microbacterium sp.]HWI31755.1 hypothetical protein [Microbacterium sp.]